MREKLLASYRKGWQLINEKCNFETVQVTEHKVLSYQGMEWNIYPGISHIDVDDETLAKWLWISRKVSEMGITGEELIRCITGLEEE